MKKFIALLLALVMVMSLAACSVEKAEAPAETQAAAPAATEAAAEAAPAAPAVASEITLWTYPIGGWGNQETVDALMADFEAASGIKVTVEYLDYTNGDDKVNTAIEGGAAPDLIMEGPERLVANWGAKGLMVDLSDLIDDTDVAELNPAAYAACVTAEGATYEYPLVMTAHCMAINKTVFEAAGAMQYLNAETHTWNSVADFWAAVDAVYAYTGAQVGSVFCGGQGGDQGTRAIVNNLNGGTFTTADHTAYTWDSAENIQALKKLAATEGIVFDASLDGGAEAGEFAKGNLAMAFCWNGATHNNQKETIGTSFEVLPMAFPSQNGTDVQLCGGIWGFGVFNNGDDAKIEAAKTFIKFMADENTKAAVEASGFWSTRKSVTDLYAGDELKAVYGSFMQYMGNYYNVVPGWAAQRTEWWNMLQDIGEGGDIDSLVAEYLAKANAAAKG